MEKKREIAKLAKIINDRVGTNLGQIHGTKSGFGKSADITATVDTKLVAKAIIEAGYGDTKQAVREFAYEFKDRCVMELKPLAWEYGEGAEDVLRIFNKVLAEVTGE